MNYHEEHLLKDEQLLKVEKIQKDNFTLPNKNGKIKL
jgi:hypothetical protein